MDNSSKKILPVIIIAIAIIAAGILIYLGFTSKSIVENTETMDNIISKEEAKNIVLNFVNNQMLQGQILATITEVGEEKGLYKLNLLVAGNSFNSYITKDGKLFFTEGILIDEFNSNFLNPEDDPNNTIEELPSQF